MREYQIERKTNETQISISLSIEGSGKAEIDTGCGFLDHMLCLFASHGKFDLSVSCKGDVNVDDHHSVEDIGICLGQAFAKALDMATTYDPRISGVLSTKGKFD